MWHLDKIIKMNSEELTSNNNKSLQETVFSLKEEIKELKEKVKKLEQNNHGDD